MSTKLDKKFLINNSEHYDVHQFNLYYRMKLHNINTEKPKNLEQLVSQAQERFIRKENLTNSIKVLENSNLIMKRAKDHKKLLIEEYNRINKNKFGSVSAKVNSHLNDKSYKKLNFDRESLSQKRMDFKVNSPLFSEMTKKPKQPIKQELQFDFTTLSKQKRKAFPSISSPEMSPLLKHKRSNFIENFSLDLKNHLHSASANNGDKSMSRLTSVQRSSLGGVLKNSILEKNSITIKEEDREIEDELQVAFKLRKNASAVVEFKLPVLGRLSETSINKKTIMRKASRKSIRTRTGRESNVEYFDFNLGNLENSRAFPFKPEINEFDLKSKMTIENKKKMKIHMDKLEQAKENIKSYLSEVLRDFK